jgi:feruloyl esterase
MMFAAFAFLFVFAATPCEKLASLSLPNVTITTAERITTGSFRQFNSLPAFCRVAATLKPSTDSDIKIEVWMPLSGWNQKFQAVGNGGWAGAISYDALAKAVRDGYATTSTDTGHIGANGKFALGHPEKLIDFGYRAVHEMTITAKEVVKAFYDNAPRFSYWNGCSTGGRQALKEAQRFPTDFDGIIAGSPANPRTRLSTWQMWIAHAALKEPASYIPPTKYPIVHKAVMETCDAIDGLKDGLIDDPRKCSFDPKVLVCTEGDGPSCLTASQVEAARKIMSPVTNPRTGETWFPRTEPGTELEWDVTAKGPEPFAAAVDQYKYVVFENPNWDWRTMNFDTDPARADAMDMDTINAIDPDLSAFQARGGKLFMYHGWADGNVAPGTSVNYYNSVVEKMGDASKISDWFRLFMMPGMAHCSGGEGPDTFQPMDVIQAWVEKGEAPSRVVASHANNGKVDRTRPLCSYPQVARYKGTGSIDDAANFECRVP